MTCRPTLPESRLFTGGSYTFLIGRATMVGDPMPGGWEETKLGDGTTAYVNHELKSFARERPSPTASQAQPPPASVPSPGGSDSATEERLVQMRGNLERLQEEKKLLERATDEGGIGLQLGLCAAGSR